MLEESPRAMLPAEEKCLGIVKEEKENVRARKHEKCQNLHKRETEKRRKSPGEEKLLETIEKKMRARRKVVLEFT